MRKVPKRRTDVKTKHINTTTEVSPEQSSRSSISEDAGTTNDQLASRATEQAWRN